MNTYRYIYIYIYIYKYTHIHIFLKSIRIRIIPSINSNQFTSSNCESIAHMDSTTWSVERFKWLRRSHTLLTCMRIPDCRFQILDSGLWTPGLATTSIYQYMSIYVYTYLYIYIYIYTYGGFPFLHIGNNTSA